MEKKNNKKKNKKFVAGFVFLLLVAVAVMVGYGTYALYQSTAQGTDAAFAAKWKVKVNGSNIVSKDKFSLKNQYIGIGEAVPVQVLVDAKESDVDVDYKFGKTDPNVRIDYSYVAFATGANNPNGNNDEAYLQELTDSLEGIYLYEWDETSGTCETGTVKTIGGTVTAGEKKIVTFCVSIGNEDNNAVGTSWATDPDGEFIATSTGKAFHGIDEITDLPLYVIARQG